MRCLFCPDLKALEKGRSGVNSVPDAAHLRDRSENRPFQFIDIMVKLIGMKDEGGHIHFDGELDFA